MYQYRLMDVYFILWVIIKHHFIFCSDCLSQLELLSVGSWVLLTHNPIIVSVCMCVCMPVCVYLSTFLQWRCKMFQALARTSRTLLKKNGKTEHSCLVPSFRGKASSCSSVDLMLAVDLLKIVLIRLSKFFSIPSLLRVITNWCWILPNAPSALTGMIT